MEGNYLFKDAFFLCSKMSPGQQKKKNLFENISTFLEKKAGTMEPDFAVCAGGGRTTRYLKLCSFAFFEILFQEVSHCWRLKIFLWSNLHWGKTEMGSIRYGKKD